MNVDVFATLADGREVLAGIAQSTAYPHRRAAVHHDPRRRKPPPNSLQTREVRVRGSASSRPADVTPAKPAVSSEPDSHDGGSFTAIALHTATRVPGRRPGSIGSVVASPVHGEQANEARYR